MLIKKVKNIIKRVIAKNYIKKFFKNSQLPRIILIGSPIHGNLGDHAISIAEKKLFKQVSDRYFLEIPGTYYSLVEKDIKKCIYKDDVLVITGGGFIGTLWLNEQSMVNSVIKNFPDNKIIIMPQTFYFSDDMTGKEELKKMQDLVIKHSDIHIFTREEKSYKFCKKNFKSANTIELIPDIVLYLNYGDKSIARKGALFCFREDKEKVMNAEVLDNLYDKFSKLNIPVSKTDTVLKHKIKLRNREYFFNEKLREFQESKIVITDRLHGMIFAAITGTPCIALDNLSHKVKGVYKWLKPLKYIVFICEPKKIDKTINKLLKCSDVTYDLDLKYKDDFDKVLKLIDD